MSEIKQNYNIPDWLTKTFFEKALTFFESKSSTLIRYDVEPATNKGENYASAIFRGKLEYHLEGLNGERKLKSVIIKTLTQNELVQQLVDNTVFEKEAMVYREILPECRNRLLRILDFTEFSPRLVYANERCIMMEDAKAMGYCSTNRLEGLDFEHSKLFIEKLAKFHAVTSVLAIEKPQSFRYHQKGGLEDEETPFHDYFRRCLSEFVTVAKTIPELISYIPALEKFDIVESVKSVYDRNDVSFVVLNHGDAWSNNALWKYSKTNQPEDVIMVDHQEGFLGSPGFDINHFIHTSCNLDVILNKTNELIQAYHNSLVLFLEKLNAPTIPTFKAINQEIAKKHDHALIVLACYVPVKLIENPLHTDPENFLMDTDEAQKVRKIVFSNPKVTEMMKALIPRFAELGIIPKPLIDY